MIEFSGVSKYYQGRAAVDALSLNCPQGAFTVLVGTSGSGKTTTLKMINQLVRHDAGQIRFAGRDISDIDPRQLRQRIGYAIQSVGLFPHWSVARNIATVPTLLGWPKQKINGRVDELLNLLGLEPALFRERYPHQLSGGQQQRVGVARALAADPDVLLMDEPFGALDPVTRTAMQQEIRRIHRLQGRTIVLVTHDVDEALRLADRVVLMDAGKVIQQGTPHELLSQPASPFVRAFFGSHEPGVRLLSLQTVAQRMRREVRYSGESVPHDLTLREALSRFVEAGVTTLGVTDAAGQPCGVLHFNDLVAVS